MLTLYADFVSISVAVNLRTWLDERGRDDSICPYCAAAIEGYSMPGCLGCCTSLQGLNRRNLSPRY